MNETIMVLLTICCVSIMVFGVSSCATQTPIKNEINSCRYACNSLAEEKDEVKCFEMCLDKTYNNKAKND